MSTPQTNPDTPIQSSPDDAKARLQDLGETTTLPREDAQYRFMFFPMRAVRWHGNRDVRVEETELSLALGPGMVEVDVTWCGICGSDIAEYAHGPFAIRPGRAHSLSGQQPPVTLGHEFSGTVRAVGEGVEAVAVGARVAADACWRCGVCAACTAGHYNRCALSGSIGLASDGAMAPRVRFP